MPKMTRFVLSRARPTERICFILLGHGVIQKTTGNSKKQTNSQKGNIRNRQNRLKRRRPKSDSSKFYKKMSLKMTSGQHSSSSHSLLPTKIPTPHEKQRHKTYKIT